MPGALEPQEAPTLTIEALPDALLGRVLARVGREAWPSTALVSKRWNRLVFEEPALWLKLTASDASLAALADPAEQQRWFACKLRLPERVGPLVQQFWVKEDHDQLVFRQEPVPGAWRLQQLLQLLQPGQLQALIVNCRWPEFPEVAAFLDLPGNDAEQLAPQLAAELQRFTAVQFLTLRGAAFEAEAVQAIAGMQQLAALVLAPALSMPDCLPTVLQQLPGTLEFLQLSGPRLPAGTVAAAALEDPQRLSALRQLTQLQLTCGGDAPVVLPLPSQFAAGLAEYGMVLQDPWAEAEGGAPVEPLEVAGALLQRAVLSEQQLTIERLVGLPSLPDLLEALLPASQPTVTRLVLSDGWLPLSALHLDGWRRCSALQAQLRALALCWCRVTEPGACGADGLAAILGATCNLESLDLQGFLLKDDSIPYSVLCAARLTSLDLSDNSLGYLPDAPMWAGLVELNLHWNELSHLPPALSTALKRLLLSNNPLLHFEEADLAVLQCMGSLTELKLGSGTAKRAPAVVLDWLGSRLTVVEEPEWVGLF